MKIFKYICLIVFLISTILYTVGWASQPILESDWKDNNKWNLTKISINNASSILFYLCILTTCLMTVGLILGMLNIITLTFASKIIFFFGMLFMIISFLIIQFGIIISNTISSIPDLDYGSVTAGNAYYLILTSTILTFITYITYAILA